MKNLIFLREQNNTTQKQLAEYLGMTRQGYAHYEQGDREPDPTTLIKLADYFNVTVDYLLGREDKEKTSIQPHKTVVQALFDELSPFEQGQIVERMKIMLEHRNIDYEKIIATCG